MKFKPHKYQQIALDKIISTPRVGLFLDMGLGKTVVTLTAIDELIYNCYEIEKVLVIAPLRVAEDTWSRECEKWDHLRHLRISKILGTPSQRRNALLKDADIYIINRENVAWLTNELSSIGNAWDFDMVVIDELSSFKSSKSQRFKALKKYITLSKRVVGLTGTPAPNGLIDLWSQIYLLDSGERLGRTVSGYRERYFLPDKRNQTTIFSYKPKEESEKAKKELSAAPSAQLNLPFIAVGKDGPHHLDISLSRPQFEMMTGDLLARTVAPVQNALRDAGISASQLGKVLLVGGSTRMPAVERQVKELLGCEPSHSLNPDECVAMGAAVQGGLLQGGGKLAGATGAAAQGLVLMDVTPLTLSIETLGGVATPLITRNSMIPTRKSQIFTTARPMQTSVEINVLQGERHFARDNKSLGKFKLTGIRASFSSKPQIEVTFDIDVNGVVKVSAKDLGTGREQNITITGSTNLSENEIQRAMADAAAYEAEDSRRKERLDLHNQAEVLAYKVDEALSKCKKELDKDEKNRIKTDLANLRRCLRKDKPEKMNENEEANLRQAKTQLEESANHLMVLYTSEQETDGTNNAL